MKTTITLISLFCLVLLTSCGGSDSSAPTPTPIVNTPGKSVLIAPVNNTTCEPGTNTTTTPKYSCFQLE